MSHGDRVTRAAAGLRGHRPLARTRPSRRSPTRRAASTACSSTPRWCTRRTARRCCATSSAGSPAAPATGRWRPSATRRSPRIRAQVGDGPGDLRPLRRRRFGRRRGADPRGDRRPAHLHLRRPRPAARWTRPSEVVDAVPRPLQHPAGARRRRATLFLERARRRHRPGGEAQDHRPLVHRRVRGRGEEDRRRRVPGPGHALSRRDRERLASPAGRRSRSSRTTTSAACPSA